MSDQSDEFTRRKVMKATGAGAMATVGMAATAQTVAANCPCTGRELGKIEKIDGTPIQDLEVGTTYEVTLTLEREQRIRTDCAACDEDKDVTVQVTPTDTNRGGDVTCVELYIDDDNGRCKCADDGLYFSGAQVKGGPGTVEYDCDDVVQTNQVYSSIPDTCAPANPNSGQGYGISNIVIEVCVFEGCYDSSTNCANDGGS